MAEGSVDPRPKKFRPGVLTLTLVGLAGPPRARAMPRPTPTHRFWYRSLERPDGVSGQANIDENIQQCMRLRVPIDCQFRAA